MLQIRAMWDEIGYAVRLGRGGREQSWTERWRVSIGFTLNATWEPKEVVGTSIRMELA